MYFYHRLRDMRLDHDLKQKAVAQLLHVSQQHYALYESGQRELPMHHFVTLAIFYNVSLDFLAGLTDQPKTLDGTPYKVTRMFSITQNNAGSITNNFN